VLNDPPRRPDSERQQTDVYVTPPVQERTTIREEVVPAETRVDVHTTAADEANRLAYERDVSPLRVREDVIQNRRLTIGKSIDIVWYVVGILEALLAVRFFFEMTGANRSAGFVQLLYGLTEPFVWPFNGIFGVPTAGTNQFDSNILVAMVVYALIGWGITRLMAMSIEPPSVA